MLFICANRGCRWIECKKACKDSKTLAILKTAKGASQGAASRQLPKLPRNGGLSRGGSSASSISGTGALPMYAEIDGIRPTPPNDRLQVLGFNDVIPLDNCSKYLLASCCSSKHSNVELNFRTSPRSVAIGYANDCRWSLEPQIYAVSARNSQRTGAPT